MSGAGHEGGAPTTTARVVIIGAGPTALGAAERLAELGFGTRPGQDVRILEASDRVGGLSASFRDARGFLWDLGGHVAFSSHARFHRMLDRALG
ncbi:MAG: NAD(P)-binding protein, partial [Myxococcales bacterium]|nr:NAD(P)-binding protein [Myxococcales bacterium]